MSNKVSVLKRVSIKDLECGGKLQHNAGLECADLSALFKSGDQSPHPNAIGLPVHLK